MWQWKPPLFGINKGNAQHIWKKKKVKHPWNSGGMLDFIDTSKHSNSLKSMREKIVCYALQNSTPPQSLLSITKYRSQWPCG